MGIMVYSLYIMRDFYHQPYDSPVTQYLGSWSPRICSWRFAMVGFVKNSRCPVLQGFRAVGFKSLSLRFRAFGGFSLEGVLSWGP